MTDISNQNANFDLNLSNTAENFIGGKLSDHLEQWQKITSDKVILEIIKANKQTTFYLFLSVMSSI